MANTPADPTDAYRHRSRGSGSLRGARLTHSRRRAVLVGGVALVVAGCGLEIPVDPRGTLDGIRSAGVLRAGASPSRDRVVLTPDTAPQGREPRLVVAYATHVGADVEWTVAGEEDLVEMLEAGELDLAVGGFTENNAWVDHVGLTRAYEDTYVMMVPMGENALQSDLERWLDQHGATP